MVYIGDGMGMGCVQIWIAVRLQAATFLSEILDLR